jgi:predicted DNA-binding protein
MERTQIYLSEGQTRELDRRARANGTTRSALIREAIGQYLAPTWDAEAFIVALNDFAGIAADRDIMADYLELNGGIGSVCDASGRPRRSSSTRMRSPRGETDRSGQQRVDRRQQE